MSSLYIVQQHYTFVIVLYGYGHCRPFHKPTTVGVQVTLKYPHILGTESLNDHKTALYVD